MERDKELYSVLLFVNKGKKEFKVESHLFNNTRNIVLRNEFGKTKKMGANTSVYLLETGEFNDYEAESVVRAYTLIFSKEFVNVDFTYEDVNIREFLKSSLQYAMYKARQVVKKGDKSIGFSPKYYVMKERELSAYDKRIEPLYLNQVSDE